MGANMQGHAPGVVGKIVFVFGRNPAKMADSGAVSVVALVMPSR